MIGITAYGAYVPRRGLQREALARIVEGPFRGDVGRRRTASRISATATLKP
jgi:3-hydroxy-3-methylglutaryl CoA synthase